LANNDYRYGYQGQYAEVDKETGWNNFDFRMYDAQIARWMSTDPMGQYASPYLGMGNNPLNRVDPDGGEDGPKPRPVVNWKDFKTSEMVVHLNDVNIHKFTPRETVSAKEFNFWDRFAMNDNLFIKMAYKTIDAPYVTYTQVFSMDKGARHLDQTSVTYNERMSAGINPLLMIVPVGNMTKLIPRINTVQFSVLTKGTFAARLSPATRSVLIATINKATGFVTGIRFAKTSVSVAEKVFPNENKSDKKK